MRAEYAHRRALVVGALDGLPLLGDTAGLHLVLRTPEDPTPLVAEAAARNILLDSLNRHFAGPQTSYGLVIGYSATPLSGLRTGCAMIRQALDQELTPAPHNHPETTEAAQCPATHGRRP
jgi:GntR family transcriptional regulator/MocR family aminotransferase